MNDVKSYKVAGEVLQGDFPYYYKYVENFFPFLPICTPDSVGVGKKGMNRKSKPCSSSACGTEYRPQEHKVRTFERSCLEVLL